MSKRRKGGSRAKACVALVMLALVYATLWLVGGIKAVAVSSYLPSFLQSLKGLQAVYWAMDYLPFAFVTSAVCAKIVLFIIALFFVEPQQTPLEDPTQVVRLIGVATSPVDHLSEAFAVCPGLDAEEIRETLASEGVSVKGH